jgi:hypothetical protein
MRDILAFTSASDRADAGAFLARVARLDPAALVRLRCAGGKVALWSWLPLEVLVTRVVRGDGPADAVVVAGALLETIAGEGLGDAGGVPGGTALPPSRDRDWRGALPTETDLRALDEIPADIVRKLLAAGEQTFREASTGADPRAVGDALLDHEVLTVSHGDVSVAVPLRLLLGLARMGFLGDDPLRIGLAGGWVRAAASYGVAFRRRTPLSLSPSPR